MDFKFYSNIITGLKCYSIMHYWFYVLKLTLFFSTLLGVISFFLWGFTGELMYLLTPEFSTKNITPFNDDISYIDYINLFQGKERIISFLYKDYFEIFCINLGPLDGFDLSTKEGLRLLDELNKTEFGIADNVKLLLNNLMCIEDLNLTEEVNLYVLRELGLFKLFVNEDFFKTLKNLKESGIVEMDSSVLNELNLKNNFKVNESILYMSSQKYYTQIFKFLGCVFILIHFSCAFLCIVYDYFLKRLVESDRGPLWFWTISIPLIVLEFFFAFVFFNYFI